MRLLEVQDKSIETSSKWQYIRHGVYLNASAKPLSTPTERSTNPSIQLSPTEESPISSGKLSPKPQAWQCILSRHDLYPTPSANPPPPPTEPSPNPSAKLSPTEESPTSSGKLSPKPQAWQCILPRHGLHPIPSANPPPPPTEPSPNPSTKMFPTEESPTSLLKLFPPPTEPSPNQSAKLSPTEQYTSLPKLSPPPIEPFPSQRIEPYEFKSREEATWVFRHAATKEELEGLEIAIEARADIEERNLRRDLSVARVCSEPIRPTRLSSISSVKPSQNPSAKRSPVHLVSESDNRKLWDAVKSGEIRAVKAAISAGADVMSRNQEQDTPLHVAARVGSEEIVRFLLTNGAKADERNVYGGTPLHCAAGSGSVGCVSELLDTNPTDIDVIDKLKQTPLHWAARNGRFHCSVFLLKKGAVLNPRTIFGETPLALARDYPTTSTYLWKIGGME